MSQQYSLETRVVARRKWEVERKPLHDISKEMIIPYYTLKEWREKDNWSKEDAMESAFEAVGVDKRKVAEVVGNILKDETAPLMQLQAVDRYVKLTTSSDGNTTVNGNQIHVYIPDNGRKPVTKQDVRTIDAEVE